MSLLQGTNLHVRVLQSPSRFKVLLVNFGEGSSEFIPGMTARFFHALAKSKLSIVLGDFVDGPFM